MRPNQARKSMGVVTDIEWINALGEKYPDWSNNSPDTLKRNKEFSEEFIKKPDLPELAAQTAINSHLSRWGS